MIGCSRKLNRILLSALIALISLSGSLAGEGPSQGSTPKKPAKQSAGPRNPVEKPFRLARFHKDLKHNFIGLFSKSNLLPLIAGAVAAGGAHAADDEVADYFGRAGRFGDGEKVGNVVGKSAVIGGVIGTMILVSRYRGDDSFRALSYSLGQGFVVTGALTFGMKKATGRDRPDGSNNRSFPSGHASQAFTFATILSHYHKKAAVPVYLAAGFIAATRLDNLVQVVRRAERQSRLLVLPYLSFSTGDVGVRVQVDLR